MVSKWAAPNMAWDLLQANIRFSQERNSTMVSRMNREELNEWAKEQGLAEPETYRAKEDVIAAVEELDTTGREQPEQQEEDRAATREAVNEPAVTVEPVAPFPPEPEPFEAGSGDVTPGTRVVANDGERDRIGTAIAKTDDGLWSVRLDTTQEVIFTKKVQPLA